jgi:hypothetical protein
LRSISHRSDHRHWTGESCGTYQPADDAIAGSVKETVLRQIRDVILQQDETRLPAGNIEPAQHFDFVAFHVD